MLLAQKSFHRKFPSFNSQELIDYLLLRHVKIMPIPKKLYLHKVADLAPRRKVPQQPCFFKEFPIVKKKKKIIPAHSRNVFHKLLSFYPSYSSYHERQKMNNVINPINILVLR